MQFLPHISSPNSWISKILDKNCIFQDPQTPLLDPSQALSDRQLIQVIGSLSQASQTPWTPLLRETDGQTIRVIGPLSRGANKCNINFRLLPYICLKEICPPNQAYMYYMQNVEWIYMGDVCTHMCHI